MDLWDYLKGLRRWWWLLIVMPLLAFGGASFLLIPAAKWEVRWESVIVFNGDPNVANLSQYLDSVVLDDMAQLLESDVLGDRVYLNLPEAVTSRYSRSEVGAMFSTVRHARFVEFTVRADEADVATIVAETTQHTMPEAINLYLIPADFTRIPAHVSVTDMLSQPELQTTERMIKVGGITLAGLIVGFAASGVAEWLRLSYSAKYGDK
jgi:hypothetical protein